MKLQLPDGWTVYIGQSIGGLLEADRLYCAVNGPLKITARSKRELLRKLKPKTGDR